MSAQKIISPERLGFKDAEEKARFIEKTYAELQDLRNFPIPANLTGYDVADAFLDTLSNYADMGPITHDDLANLVRDAAEQLDDEAHS